jgi:single-strand DNA-binding protein
MDLNKAMLIGNLTRDPELRYTPAGQAVVSFGLATNRRWTDSQTGELKEQAEFHNIVAWGKLAETCNQILKKGRKTYVEGRLQTRSWEGQDGAKRSRTEIIANNVIVLDRKPREAGEVVSEKEGEEKEIKKEPEEKKKKGKGKEKEPISTNPSAGQAETTAGKKEKKDEEEIDLDDIPF